MNQNRSVTTQPFLVFFKKNVICILYCPISATHTSQTGMRPNGYRPRVEEGPAKPRKGDVVYQHENFRLSKTLIHQ